MVNTSRPPLQIDEVFHHLGTPSGTVNVGVIAALVLIEALMLWSGEGP